MKDCDHTLSHLWSIPPMKLVSKKGNNVSEYQLSVAEWPDFAERVLFLLPVMLMERRMYPTALCRRWVIDCRCSSLQGNSLCSQTDKIDIEADILRMHWDPWVCEQDGLDLHYLVSLAGEREWSWLRYHRVNGPLWELKWQQLRCWWESERTGACLDRSGGDPIWLMYVILISLCLSLLVHCKVVWLSIDYHCCLLMFVLIHI